jgi:hypothetical protein
VDVDDVCVGRRVSQLDATIAAIVRARYFARDLECIIYLLRDAA